MLRTSTASFTSQGFILSKKVSVRFAHSDVPVAIFRPAEATTHDQDAFVLQQPKPLSEKAQKAKSFLQWLGFTWRPKFYKGKIAELANRYDAQLAAEGKSGRYVNPGDKGIF